MASIKEGSSSSPSTANQAFNGIGSLIKLLPTGTLFMYHFLSPILSNYGQCHPVNKYFMGALLIVCGFNCAFTTFTDSYRDEEGKIHYGIVTWKGLWPSGKDNSAVLSKYKLRFADFVHAITSLVVFAVVAVLDHNTVSCFAPTWESKSKTTLMVLPTIVGSICSTVFSIFPSTRHGIGYPSSESS